LGYTADIAIQSIMSATKIKKRSFMFSHVLEDLESAMLDAMIDLGSKEQLLKSYQVAPREVMIDFLSSKKNLHKIQNEIRLLEYGY